MEARFNKLEAMLLTIIKRVDAVITAQQFLTDELTGPPKSNKPN